MTFIRIRPARCCRSEELPHRKDSDSVLVIDILSGALSGAGCTRADETRPGNGIFVTAINIASFVETPAFNEEVDRFVEYVKSAQKRPGVEEIYVPGERGFPRARKTGARRHVH